MVVETWFLRRLLKISWTENVTNKEILKKKKTAINRELWSIINKRKIAYFGHIIREDEYHILRTILQGRIEKRKNRPPTGWNKFG